MTDYTAKIRAKGLEATGVTEELAQTMYNTPGKTTLAIVEMKHVRQIHDADGDRKVELVLTMVEPATSAELEDYLRNLTRTMHQNRVLKSTDDQLKIDTIDDLEPTVEGVIEAGQQFIAETDDPMPDPDAEDPDADPLEAGGDLNEDPNALADDGWEYDQSEPREPSTVGSPFGTTGDDAA